MVGIFALVLPVVLALPTSASAIPINSPGQLSPNPTTIDFESLETGSDVITTVANPLQTAQRSRTIHCIPGAERDSAISNLGSLRLTRY
jgi:hypothetical protein